MCVLVLCAVNRACFCFVCDLPCDDVCVAAVSACLCVFECVCACCLKVTVMFDGLLLLCVCLPVFGCAVFV